MDLSDLSMVLLLLRDVLRSVITGAGVPCVTVTGA